MHDGKGRELKVGDRVMIPCIVRGVQAMPLYCNATVETEATMPGSNGTSTWAVNTRQMLRALDGDDLSFVIKEGLQGQKDIE